MDLELKQYLKTLRVKASPKNESVEDLEKRIQLCEQAGFSALATRLKDELVIQKKLNIFKDRLIIQRPKWKWIKITIRDGYKLIINRIFGRKISLRALKISKKKYLVEIPSRMFVGQIPMSMLEEASKARQKELCPVIWTVATKDELKNIVRMPPRDPILVAYPSYWESDLVIVLGVWGEDIEEIDRLFES